LGLIVSQALTQFTTPVTYLYVDRFNHFATTLLRGKRPCVAEAPCGGARRSSDSELIILENVR
jgi:hypothetical protein